MAMIAEINRRLVNDMEAYIFDLDGTLLDSMGIWQEIDAGFLKQRGIVVPDDYADMVSAMSFEQADGVIYDFKDAPLPK